jgi:hypothetical protein
MAGPLAGIGQAQSLPISNTFQPGGATNGQQQVRERDNQNNQQTNQVQAQGAPTNQTQQAETNNRNSQQSFQVAQNEARSADSGEQRRGSVIDIQV